MITSVFAQSNDNVRFDGLYVVKTGEIDIPNNKIEIYMYIRFYEDGTVYTQSVSAYDPAKVIEWLGKEGRFERMGNYHIEGKSISFNVNNDDSPDKNLEGARTDKYLGTMEAGNLQLNLTFDSGKTGDFTFVFVAVE
jgi:hypothetical protein